MLSVWFVAHCVKHEDVFDIVTAALSLDCYGMPIPPTCSILRVTWAREQYKIGEDFYTYYERIKCRASIRRAWEKQRCPTSAEDCYVYSHLRPLQLGLELYWNCRCNKTRTCYLIFNSKNTHAPSISHWSLRLGCNVRLVNEKKRKGTYVRNFMVDCVRTGTRTIYALLWASSFTRRDLFTCDSISGYTIEIWMRFWFHRVRHCGKRTTNQFCHRLSH